MAEYIKFRLTAAKASVTLAFLALVGGLAGPAQAKQHDPSAKAASFSWGDPIYLKLDGLGGATQKVFSTLEYKLNHALSSFSHKLNTTFYDKHKIDTTFLKIDSANKLYYKESQVNADFLKIEDANASFLKIDAASAEFLKITDANNAFLKIDGTAANAQKLGGLTPDAFVQGHANVLSNELVASSAQQALLGDGSVKVLIGLDVNSNPTVTLENDTSSPLTFSMNPNPNVSTPRSNTIPGNGGQVTLTLTGNLNQLDFQIFASGGGGGAGKLWTATLSQLNGSGTQTFVGQMLIGNL